MTIGGICIEWRAAIWAQCPAFWAHCSAKTPIELQFGPIGLQNRILKRP